MNGIAHSICRTAVKRIKIADTQRRMIDHISVSCLHTSRIILRGQYNFLICPAADIPVYIPVLFRPTVRLVPTGNNHNQFHVRMTPAKCQHLQSGKRIKTDRAAAQETTVSGPVGFTDFTNKQRHNGTELLRRQSTMSRKACSFCHHESILSTARNASLGTWTVPN